MNTRSKRNFPCSLWWLLALVPGCALCVALMLWIARLIEQAIRSAGA
jgi:hypothetical protein